MPDGRSPLRAGLRRRANLPGYAWLIAFLLFPFGPYITLYLSGAMPMLRAASCVLLTMALSAAYSFALARTEANPDAQLWVLQSMLLFLGLAAVHQYGLGARLKLWPRSGLRVWRRMAWTGFLLYALSVFSAIMKLLMPGIGAI